jgi:hypothetical protein
VRKGLIDFPETREKLLRLELPQAWQSARSRRFPPLKDWPHGAYVTW